MLGLSLRPGQLMPQAAVLIIENQAVVAADLGRQDRSHELIRDLVTVIVEQDQPTLLRGLLFNIRSTKHAEERISRLNADLRQMNEQLQSRNLD